MRLRARQSAGELAAARLMAACSSSGLLPRVPSLSLNMVPISFFSSRTFLPRPPPMDDLAHESRRPIHSINRKRKADNDDHNGPNTVTDAPANAEPMLIDVQATPRCPADSTPGPSTASWPIVRSRQGMTSSWPPPSPSSCPSPSAFIPKRAQEGQPSPKRLRIEIPTTPPSSPHRMRRAQRQPSSRLTRHRRTGDTRDTGIVSATEPGPSSGSLLRTASLPPLPSQSSRSVPASPIEPITISPHIPPHQTPINRETLKELDLEAILRNPQLRQSQFLLRLATLPYLIFAYVLCRP